MRYKIRCYPEVSRAMVSLRVAPSKGSPGHFDRLSMVPNGIWGILIVPNGIKIESAKWSPILQRLQCSQSVQQLHIILSKNSDQILIIKKTSQLKLMIESADRTFWSSILNVLIECFKLELLTKSWRVLIKSSGQKLCSKALAKGFDQELWWSKARPKEAAAIKN